MTSFTDILNLTIDENDSNSDISQISMHSAIIDIQINMHSAIVDNQFNKHSAIVDNQFNKHSAIVCSTIITDDEIKDSKKQKSNNKRPGTSKSPRAKRLRLQPLEIITTEVFHKSETFKCPGFLSWLKSNPHLRNIKGGESEIFELLDKVRRENRGVNKIFLALAETNEKVNPHFFNIADIVLPEDSIIFPPEWRDRTDLGATYVWSFDIPNEDVRNYCDEIEKDISVHPHRDTETFDYRAAIVAQFRNYLEKELPLYKQVKVFRWLYVGQTTRCPPFTRWREYYKRESSQRTLNVAMFILTKPERNVPHRLVVVSSDGSENMEAVVAALLNIRVDSGGQEANAINRALCGSRRFQPFCAEDEQTLALQKYNPDIEMIICVHCNHTITINPRSSNGHCLRAHVCPASGWKRNGRNKANAMVYARLFTQMIWCPRKDTCQACAAIVPRPEDDILKDLSLREILLKSVGWKRERQRLALHAYDIQKSTTGCFYGKDSVQLATGGIRLIEELKIGDRVWSMDHQKNELIQDEIILLRRSEPTNLNIFYKFETMEGHHLSLTGSHYIPVYHSNNNQLQMIRSSQVTMEHQLILFDRTISIRNISIHSRQGFYSLLTLTNYLLVNQISTSVLSDNDQVSIDTVHVFYRPVRLYYHLMRWVYGSTYIPFEQIKEGLHPIARSYEQYQTALQVLIISSQYILSSLIDILGRAMYSLIFVSF